MAWPKRGWTDLQKTRRRTWTQCGAWRDAPGGGPPPVDLEARRLAAAMRERVRARRVAEGRL
mgnify:CR=1 FL=1